MKFHMSKSFTSSSVLRMEEKCINKHKENVGADVRDARSIYFKFTE